MAFICPFPLTLYLLLTWINGLSQKHHVEGLSRYNSMLIGRKNQVKFENDSVSRNGHKIKITQPNSMILVLFSSAEDALFNDVKSMTLLAPKVLKIRISRSACLGTPTIRTDIIIICYWPSHCCSSPWPPWAPSEAPCSPSPAWCTCPWAPGPPGPPRPAPRSGPPAWLPPPSGSPAPGGCRIKRRIWNYIFAILPIFERISTTHYRLWIRISLQLWQVCLGWMKHNTMIARWMNELSVAILPILDRLSMTHYKLWI